VRVRGGFFAGVEGVVTELRRQCRVVLTLSAVNQSFSLEVDMNELTVLDKPATAAGFGHIPVFSY
jgi:hypothetical protein